MEPDTWLKYCREYYECIAVHVDGLLIASKDPHGAVDALTNKHHFKHKGTGHTSYHIGCDFGRDGDGTLHFTPRKHVEKMEKYYHIMFRLKPKEIYASPLEKGDNPELDTSKCLDQDGIQRQQSFIGAMQ